MQTKKYLQSQFSQNYTRLYSWTEKWTNVQVEFIKRHLAVGIKVLDLGCGYGRITEPLIEAGYDVVGLDFSKELLDIARTGKGVYVEGDMRSLTYDNEFDAVINIFTSFGFWKNKKDYDKTISGVCRALKPCGVFILDYTAKNDQKQWKVIEHRDGKDTFKVSYRQYSEDEMRYLIEKNGFAVEDVYYNYVSNGKGTRMIFLAKKIS